jgi:hypothetical protein
MKCVRIGRVLLGSAMDQPCHWDDGFNRINGSGPDTVPADGRKIGPAMHLAHFAGSGCRL